MTPMKSLRRGARRATLGLTVTACSGAALAGALTGVAASASGAPVGSPGETAASPSGASGCPSSNPPNEMTLVAGTPQTALLGTAFATGLQVALGNSDGCPVTAAAGIPVTFSAPASGASGAFATSASNTAVVGADASGTVAAPPFTANTIAGSYTLTASSQYGSVSFALTNTAAGVPARIVAIPAPPKDRSAEVTDRCAQPLQVRVLDAAGDAVAGASVTFTLGSGGSGPCGASSSSAGATFAGARTEATATTGAGGVASSPPFTANGTSGSFSATAAVAGAEPGGASGGEGAAASSGAAASAGAAATPASFALSNLAGEPAVLTAGVGSSQSTPAGTAFPVRLAVTVTDAHGNRVAGAPIVFAAPLAGASGRFTVRVRMPHHRVRLSHARIVEVETDACGIALAPRFTADETQGGYIVKAGAERARPAAFALVNTAHGQSP
jgi:hypothetical protein